MHTPITRLLRCDLPIVQAPMAGGADTPALVAAVGNAGAFGFLGAAYLTPDQIHAAASAVRAASARPFGINLFAPQAPQPAGDLDAARARLAPYYAELGLSLPALPQAQDTFDAQLDAALATDASAIGFTFGIPPAPALAKIRAARRATIGTATTVAEARAWRHAGCDALVAQGAEAGGHRGTFLGEIHDALIGTLALVPQIVDATGLPVLASGGIMDGRGIAAALMLGAGAVQMGTAFLTTPEAGVPEVYKRAVLDAHEDGTCLTRAFSGRHARGLANRFAREMAAVDVPPFPLQNALTRPLRSAAAKAGRAEFLSLWCGQAPRLARRLPAAELVAALARETRAALEDSARLAAAGDTR